MCGFIAIYYKNEIFGQKVTNTHDEMRSLLHHRGPDEFKTFTSSNGRLDLFFYRLSIIDLDHGSQPISSSDGTIISVFNGEIYNFKELREELASEGVTLKTQGDAEVIPNLFALHGPNFVNKLRGMFTIVLWDGEKVHVYRDRFGIKPLYQAEDDEKVIFSSEVKPLVSLTSINKTISIKALADYLRYGYVLGPHNIFSDVKSIAPASYLCLDGKRTTENLFYDIATDKVSATNERDALKQLEDKIFETVSCHLTADVPVGIFLSGGLDSGLIAAMASQVNPSIKTLTLKFEGAPVDESTVAHDIAKHCGLDHEVISVTSDDLLKVMVESIWRMESPLADSGALANFLISKHAKNRGLKVVLCGAGGDELFAGYTYHVKSKLEEKLYPFRYLAPLMMPFVGKERRRKLKRSLSFDKDPLFHYLDKTRVFFDVSIFSDSLVDEDLKSYWFKNTKASHKLKRLYSDLHTYIPSNLMLLLDRATMSSSIEGRVPFLDHELADLAFTFNDDIRTPGGERKGLLKKLARKHLPSSVFELPKIGFNSPVEAWMNGPLADKVDLILRSERFLNRSFWERTKIEKIISEPLNFHQKWTLFQLELFCLIHVDQEFTSLEDIHWDQL
jgi:asparagine synthase (glutamine-hydrolysing)